MRAKVSEKSTAHYRGRVSVRPWRVGVLTDVDDVDKVTRAMIQLSSIWGGLYMPILDASMELDALRAAMRLFDVDSVYAEDASDDLEELLRSSHYGWRGARNTDPSRARLDYKWVPSPPLHWPHQIALRSHLGRGRLNLQSRSRRT